MLGRPVRRWPPLLLIVALAAAAPLAAILPASADAHVAAGGQRDRPGAARASERVVKDDVAITVRRDGTLRARETIVYEFAGGRGFDRSFTTRTRHSDTHDRIFTIAGVRASSPDGGPSAVRTTTKGDRTTVRVSGTSRLNGRRTVMLEYDVRGVITSRGDTQELRWTVVGGWRVPVDTASATVRGGPVRSVNCFAGAPDSVVGCTQLYSDHTHSQGIFAQQSLLPGEQFTIVVGYPADYTRAEPTFERRRTLATAFTVNRATGGALIALLVLLAAGFTLLYLVRGRDARTVGKRAAEGDRPATGQAGAPADGSEGEAAESDFAPPDGVRPGQIGTLIDEQADVIDVTATIVDLAVRGYLLIEEEDRAATGRLDWALRRLPRPIEDLLPYERILRDALFAGRDVVRLSELGGTFTGDLAAVRAAMYDDVVRQGWFARRPDSVRTRWTTAGMVLTVLGLAGTAILAIFTDLALIGLAVIIGGAAMAFAGQHMPAKTARGSTVLAHTIGFRAFLARGEVPNVPERQRIALFSRYLPYAVVFDLVRQWAETVEDAGVRQEGADNLYWYEGPAEWDLSKFSESMRAFTLTTSGAISQSRQFRTI